MQANGDTPMMGGRKEGLKEEKGREKGLKAKFM